MTYNPTFYSRNRDKQRAKKDDWNSANRDKVREYARRSKIKLRSEVFNAYGNKCACCGESNWQFLCIDHINGGGNEHRKKVGIGKKFYAWLKRNGFPKDDFRLLCHNCNMARALYKRCPHELQ